MATYQDLIDLALQQSLAGGDQLRSALLDADMTMEAFVGNVFQAVALRLAASESTRSLLRRTHTLTLANGVATVPDTVLTQCWIGASIADPDDVVVAQTQSYVPYWSDFVQPRDGIQSIPWWIFKGDTEFHYLEAGEDYDPVDGFDGELELTIASVPEIPATSTDTLDVPAEVYSDLVDGLAKAISTLVASRKGG